jgi:hypothetical protein
MPSAGSTLTPAGAADVPLLATNAELRRAMDENTRGRIRDFLAWLVSDSTEIRPAAEATEFARIVHPSTVPPPWTWPDYRCCHASSCPLAPLCVPD